MVLEVWEGPRVMDALHLREALGSYAWHIRAAIVGWHCSGLRVSFRLLRAAAGCCKSA